MAEPSPGSGPVSRRGYRLAVSLVFVATAVLAIVTVFFVQRRSRQRVDAVLAAQPYSPIDLRGSPEFRQLHEMLFDDLGHARLWTVADAAALASIITSEQAREDSDGSLRGMSRDEARLLRELSLGLIATRGMLDLPIEPQGKRVLSDALLSILASPRSSHRVIAISAVVQGRFIEDATIRARIEAFRNDSDTDIAANASTSTRSLRSPS